MKLAAGRMKSLSLMKIDVKETFTVQKDLLDILQGYESSRAAQEICNGGLKRSLTSILEHDNIRSQLLAILAFKPFQGIITAGSLHSFARLLDAGAQTYLSNAFCRILDFWTDFPPSPSLVKWLEGKWGCEITEEAFKRWSDITSERYSGELLSKIRSQSCRIITLKTVIAESRTFHFFFKPFTPTGTLTEFLGKVSEFTSNESCAPRWTKLRQVSQPTNGIWSQKPHASIQDLYPATSELLIFSGELSIKALFQDFVMVFFGASAYKDLGPRQSEPTVQSCRMHTKMSIPIESTRKALIEHGMISVDGLEGTNKSSQYSRGEFRLGHVCRSPPTPIKVCHKSQTATLLHVEPIPSAEELTCSHIIQQSIGAATENNIDISTTSTLGAGRSLHPGEFLTGIYTSSLDARDFEDVHVSASVAVAKRTVEDTEHDTNDVRAISGLEDYFDPLPAARNPTASWIAECYRAEFLPLEEEWGSDATTLNEPATPTQGEEGLGDMFFTIVRLLEDKDPDQLYLVPSHITELSEILQVIQECRYPLVELLQREDDEERSRREAAIAMYGRPLITTTKTKNLFSKLAHRIVQPLQRPQPRASTRTGPFHVRI